MSTQEFQPGQNGQQPATGTKTYKLLLVLQTGGEQPREAKPEEINRFFTGNYAKAWAMKDGFMPTFQEYRDKTLVFDLISDARFRGHAFFLCRWVAQKYKKLVDVLKEAEYFEVKHFVTSGQIGYNVREDTPAAELERLSRLVKTTCASLPTDPMYFHTGRIV